MECNRDDAVRSKDIAERKFRENDIAGALKFALKARALFKPLEGIDQMIAALNVHIRAQKKVGGENDWYEILELPPLADEDAIKKQYKKLAFQTHPDKNNSVCAEAAFNLISDAWTVLSDTAKRIVYDRKRHICGLQNDNKVRACDTSNSSTSSVNGFEERPRKVASHLAHQVQGTFWTRCSSCFSGFEYFREYVDQKMKCVQCHAVFVAAEVPPLHPMYPNGPTATATNDNICGNTVPVMATPGVSAGVSCGVDTNEGDSRKMMQGVRKHVRRANAATREHEAAKRRCTSGDKQATSQSGDGCKPMCPAKRGPRSTAETSCAKKRKVSSADLGNTVGRTSFSRVLVQLDVRGVLIACGKLQIREKLQEFNSKKGHTKNKERRQNRKKSSTKIACNTTVEVNKTEMKPSIGLVDPKGDVMKLVSKRVDLEENKGEKCSEQVSLEEKLNSWQWRSRDIHIVYTRRNRNAHKKELGDGETGANPATEHHVANKYGCLNQESSTDEGSGQMVVPDADFYNFGEHSESSFQSNQVWAMYDEEDGMPRYYALIRKVLSTSPFKARLAYLKANDCDEFGSSNWISYGYSKTFGEFNIGASKITDQVNIFSHKVKCEKGPGVIIRIFPEKGDIWALYQNWSPDWDEFTPDDTMYKYELIEVIDSYNPAGISVIPIVKIPGFVSVFKPFHDATKVRRVPKEEMLRFSHQVPFHVLTGEEAPNAPKGCYELDPGSTPQELLRVDPPSGDAK
ncbi:hypothetical protein HU200_064665 [Digitaria exilis]|uniref:J domain-containing protein n=1 Tax=Digitaria exilis TaxID=1010633 RepID=A0A835A500_9POAL|nr:hypothetical protein HU200_064665 [Digitaria exilis]